MSLEEAFEIVQSAGYKISRPRATKAHDPQRIIETNPLGHAFPHAKLKNVSLTSITRLNKGTMPRMIENNDPRNFTVSKGISDAWRYYFYWQLPTL